jgi:hypothetical protein
MHRCVWKNESVVFSDCKYYYVVGLAMEYRHSEMGHRIQPKHFLAPRRYRKTLKSKCVLIDERLITFPIQVRCGIDYCYAIAESANETLLFIRFVGFCSGTAVLGAACVQPDLRISCFHSSVNHWPARNLCWY